MLSAWMVGGCTPAVQDAPAPTVTLVPPTATATPTPITPTATNANTTAPEVTIPAQQTDTTATDAAPSSRIDIDPVAGQLAFVAQRQIADETGLPISRIRVIDVQTITWRDSSLGCPLPDQAYTQVETDGYRLVLQAGETEYIYHTDVDRVFRCDPANEVLPAAEPTAEANEDE